jgi:hypothetical protein
MMKWRNTGILAGLAVALFAFIFLYERHTGPSQAPAAPVSRLLPRLRAAEVTATQVRLTNLVLKAERVGDFWTLTAPLAYPAAPVAIERLLKGLENAIVSVQLSPRDLNSRRQKSSDFGLEPPQASIVVERGSDRVELQIGGLTTTGEQVYVQVVGVAGISVTDAGLLGLLPRTVSDWRNLAVLDPVEAEPDRVEVIKAGGGISLQRDPTNQLWQLARPRLRADQLKVTGLLGRLRQSRVTQFVSDDPKVDLEAYGLQSPVLELLVGYGTNLLERVVFGTNSPSDSGNVYARRLSHTNIVLVPRALVDLLQSAPAEYRERRIFPFQPDSVSQIEVRSEEPFTLRRQTNGAWLAGETAADAAFVGDWLVQLSQLQAAEFVKDVVTDFSSYGLAQPVRQYLLKTTVTNATGTTNLLLGEIDFGTNTLEKVYVRRGDEDSVYSVRYLDYFHMPASSWQLREHRVWSFTTNQVVRVTLREGGRNRVLMRSASGEWAIAVGVPGRINPFGVEEMLFRLGELEAPTWVARGQDNLARFGFGETNLQISLELKVGDKNQTLTLDFGGPSATHAPYAAVTLGGEVWIFEFPWGLYRHLPHTFGLPLSEMGSPAPANRNAMDRPTGRVSPQGEALLAGGDRSPRRRPADGAGR